MSKHLTKLAAACVLLLTALVLGLVGTYAWFVLSTAPEAGGMQLTIGGSRTIQVAPDLTRIQEGVTVHYPGEFSRTLDLAAGEDSVLNRFGGLRPVSTADGLHWYLPVYDSLEEGAALKDFSEFIEDTTLIWANGTDPEAGNGSYLYLDFWVMAPEEGCTLRVSAGSDGEGSYVRQLPAVKADGSDYALDMKAVAAEASIRIGFLVSEADMPGEGAWQSLRGSYQEPGQAAEETGGAADSRFIIYEPNGDLHPAGTVPEGRYLITEPLGPGKTPTNVGSRLTVQKLSRWTEEAGQPVLGRMLRGALLQAAAAGVTLNNEEDVSHYLYGTYLPQQAAAYVAAGSFIEDTQALYTLAGSPAGAETGSLASAGATEGAAIVRLEPNVPQRIRMFIWLEGQDADCSRDAGSSTAGTLVIRLELAGESEADA